MSEIFLLYLVTRLDSVAAMFVAMGMATCGIAIGYTISILDQKDDGVPQRRKTRNKALWLTVAFCVAVAITPRTKDAMLLIAASLTINAVKSETGHRIAGKTVRAFEALLDEYLVKDGKK